MSQSIHSWMVLSLTIAFLSVFSRVSMASISWECSGTFWASAIPSSLVGPDRHIDAEFLNAEPCNEQGDSVAHIAARHVQSSDVMRFLILSGADVEATNIHGDTVWDYATENQYDPEGVVQAMESAMTPSDGDDDGETEHPYYFSLNMGLAHANQVSTSLNAYTIPSRCDSNLYIDPAMVPVGDAACSNDVFKPVETNDFSPGIGPTFGVKVGRKLGDSPLRVEFEYRNRRQGDDQGLLNQDLDPATSQWSQAFPPRDSLSHYSAHEFFGNVHYDFEIESGPIDRFHLGAGAGVSRVSADYARLLMRKTRAEGFHSVPGRPPLAAGTISLLEHSGEASRFIGQIVGGFERDIGERTSLGFNAYWARLARGIEGNDIPYSTYRSHEPIMANGEPRTGDLTLDNLSYVGASLELKLRF